jgi:hypothetical protein
MRKKGFGAIATLVALATVALIGANTALAGNGNGKGPKWGDVRFAGDDVRRGHKPVKKGDVQPAPLAAAGVQAAAATATPPIGTEKTWLIYNEVEGRYQLATFTLRGVGEHVEVWVQNNLTFPAGDCRNGTRTTVTDDQVAYFIQEFDTNIYPKESAAFSTPPARAGEDAVLDDLLGLPADYYQGEGDNIVVLISNVRDTNYYDTNNAHEYTYIAGFFSGQLNDYFDRNVMTVDAYDWLHRTGANPPNEPVPGDPCASMPARPYLYEGVFAHEYQHLLESYASPGELSWVNEGLSDYAISLTGYGHPELSINDSGFDSHVQCFLGWLGVQTPANPNPRAEGGPENSLTQWKDQGEDEVLCDYGAVYTFMLYLNSQYGPQFLSALHNEDATGFAGLQAVLDQFVTGQTAIDVVHRWAAAVALDAALESTTLRGSAQASQYSIPQLHAAINWDTPEAYSTPGAPPNGSDYVRLRDSAGQYLTAKQIQSISFQGATGLPPLPIEWTIDSGALYSGTGDLLDRAITRQVTVPTTNATLSFTTRYNLEETWDFGFVQVSTDGGATYTSIACTGSRSDVAEGAFPTVQTNVPGFTGVQDWTSVNCDLSKYAGQTIVVSFRLITDWATEGNEGAPFAAGWWVKDVVLGATTISSGTSLEGWKSSTEQHPYPVSWTLQLIGIDTSGGTPATLAEVPVGPDGTVTLERGELRRLIGNQTDLVGAIVTFDDPTEGAYTYAPYQLQVNGVFQPGGGPQPAA